MSYTPTIPPADPAAIPHYLTTELQALAQSLQQSQPYAYLQTLNVAPAKPREGLIAKADGTHWNPGSGAGVYCYIAGAWVFFGGGGGTGTVTHTSGALTAHAVIVGNGTADVKALAALGASGTVLTSNGAGADPSFQPGGGTGTVTSVGVGSTGSTLTVTGSPVTGSGTINADLNLAHSNLFTAPQGCTVGTLTSSNSVTPAWNSGAGNDFTLTFVNTWLTPTINAPSGSPPTNADMVIYTTQPATGGPVQPTFDPAFYVWGNGGQDAQPLAATAASATDTWAFKLLPSGKWHGTKIGQSGATGPGYGCTSTTSLTIASTGSQTLTVPAGMAWLANASRIRIASRSTGALMEGACSSYSGTSLVFAADYSSGSGTLTDWNVSLTGQVGATGPQGVAGPAGSGSGVNTISTTTYTVLTSDASKLLVFTNLAGCAVTVPQATVSFASPFKFSVRNSNVGTVTFTPTTSTVDGAASLSITQNQGCDWSSDSTNWNTQRGIGAGSGSTVKYAAVVGNNGGNISTTSLTLADITGMVVSVAAAVGDRIRVHFHGSWIASAGSQSPFIAFKVNTTDLATQQQQVTFITAYAGNVLPVTGYAAFTAASGDISGGNVTVQARFRNQIASTLTVLNSSGVNPVMSIENFGP